MESVFRGCDDPSEPCFWCGAQPPVQPITLCDLPFCRGCLLEDHELPPPVRLEFEVTGGVEEQPS